MKRILFAGIILLCSVALLDLAEAGRGRGGGKGLPRGPALLKIAKEAGLSDAQIAKIRKISLASQRKAVDLRADAAKLRLDLRELMEANLLCHITSH